MKLPLPDQLAEQLRREVIEVVRQRVYDEVNRPPRWFDWAVPLLSTLSMWGVLTAISFAGVAIAAWLRWPTWTVMFFAIGVGVWSGLRRWSHHLDRWWICRLAKPRVDRSWEKHLQETTQEMALYLAKSLRSAGSPTCTISAEYGPRYLTCWLCLHHSYHPKDIENRYCNYCKVFHDDLAAQIQLEEEIAAAKE